MNIVVGTGPASVAAAKSLLNAGEEVTILEPGCSLESTLELQKIKLSKAEPIDWTEEDLQPITSKVKSTTKGIPKKLVYGSDYVYREVDGASALEFESASMTRSFAKGGLSNVWGACIMPYPTDELVNWPDGSKICSEDYAAVLRFVPHAGGDSRFGERLPLYSDSYAPFPLSNQAEAFEKDLEKKSELLRSNGLLFGRSRLAVSNTVQGTGACRECAMCLYGCPYDLIYSTAHTVQELIQDDRVTYLPGNLVRTFTETPDGIVLSIKDVQSGKIKKLHGDRVFIGAGVVETARIVLESLELYNHPIRVRHSDRFMLPFLRFKGTTGVYQEKLHTLCQIFLEVHDRSISQYDVHLQAYTYNDLFKKALDSKLGPIAGLFAWPVRMLLARLVIFFGYIHSEESAHMRLEVKEGEPSTVKISGVPNPIAKKTMWRVVRKLFRHFGALGGVVGLPVLDPPGGGNHTGGTFPMRENPSELETDTLGRLKGFRRVHLVDSSVFPSLPAATITLSIMANSYRIAREAVACSSNEVGEKLVAKDSSSSLSWS